MASQYIDPTLAFEGGLPTPAGVPARGLDQRQRDFAIRTIYGEDPNLSAEAVANVIRNRAEAGRYGGNDVEGVVLAKNQFEPWNNAKAKERMLGLAPDSPEYQRLGALVDRVWAGEAPDITGGATHFYAPKAQAALGRSVPAWAKGEGQQIGPHVFFAPEGRVSRGAPTAMPQGGQPQAPQMPAQAVSQPPMIGGAPAPQNAPAPAAAPNFANMAPPAASEPAKTDPFATAEKDHYAAIKAPPMLSAQLRPRPQADFSRLRMMLAQR